MAKPGQPERGVRGFRQFRYGHSIPGCSGVDKSHDRSVLPPTALVEGINCRVHDKIVVERGGQTLINSGTTMQGCVYGLADVKGSGPRAILTPTVSNPVGYSNIDIYNRYLESGETYVRVTVPGASEITERPTQLACKDDTKARYCMTWWNDQLVMVADVNPSYGYWYLHKVVPPEDTDARMLKLEQLLELKVPGEANFFLPASMATLPLSLHGSSPPLYFGTVGGGVVRYSGGQLERLLAEGTFTNRVLVFRYQDTIWACGAQLLKRYKEQTTWENITLPVGSFPTGVSDFRPVCAMEYLDECYLGGWDDDVTPSLGQPGPGCALIIDGTTVTVGRAATNADCYDDALVFGSVLAFSWREDSDVMSSPGAHIGGYNGSSWNDKAISIWGEADPIVPRMVIPGVSLGYGAILYCTGVDSPTVPPGIWEVTGSPMSSMSGTRLVNTDDLYGDSVASFDMALY